jgi:hypothetical protein
MPSKFIGVIFMFYRTQNKWGGYIEQKQIDEWVWYIIYIVCYCWIQVCYGFYTKKKYLFVSTRGSSFANKLDLGKIEGMITVI